MTTPKRTAGLTATAELAVALKSIVSVLDAERERLTTIGPHTWKEIGDRLLAASAFARHQQTNWPTPKDADEPDDGYIDDVPGPEYAIIDVPPEVGHAQT